VNDAMVVNDGVKSDLWFHGVKGGCTLRNGHAQCRKPPQIAYIRF
jgi:hypothetical protein